MTMSMGSSYWVINGKIKFNKRVFALVSILGFAYGGGTLREFPTLPYIQTVFRILRYLKFAPGKAVLFSKHGHLQIEAFTDADWTNSLDDRRSTSRYCTFVGGNLFTWRRKK